ncbi:hypothetical protein MASR2M78_26080 [Treponema sp.]
MSLLRRSVVLTVLFFSVLLKLPAQTESDTKTPRSVRRIVVSLQSSPEMDRAALEESLLRSIVRSTAGIARRAEEGEDPLAKASLQGEALVLRVAMEVRSGSLLCSWEIVDARDGIVLQSGAKEGPQVSKKDLEEWYWLDIADVLLGLKPKLPLLHIQAAPGTQLRGFSKKPIVVDGSGSIELQAKLPSSFEWKAKRINTRPSSGQLVFFEAGQIFNIQLEALKIWAIELSLYHLSFPSIAVYRSLASDRAFLRLSLNQELFGFSLDRQKAFEETDLIAHKDLLSLGTSLGVYAFDAGERLRPYLGIGAELEIDSAAWQFSGATPVHILPSIGLDWRLLNNSSVFLELGRPFGIPESRAPSMDVFAVMGARLRF